VALGVVMTIDDLEVSGAKGNNRLHASQVTSCRRIR
jgi:hypothetical protein